MFREKCLICKSGGIKKILDFGRHPLADSFISVENLEKSDINCSLEVGLCKKCGCVQLMHDTDPQERYVLNDYSYTSSNSDFSRNHWKEYVKDIAEKFDLQGYESIVDIGSNDGFLLKKFSDYGFNGFLTGVDPSAVMASLAKTKYGIDTVVDLFPFTREINNTWFSIYGKPYIIIANNVFNHANNPLDFVKEVSHLLDDKGYFVFELPYWLDSVTNKKFDQVYGEHQTYFTVRSSEYLLNLANLKIVGVEKIDYHGGSVRIYATKNGDIRINNEKEMFIQIEEEAGLFSEDTYRDWFEKLNEQRFKFIKKICDIKLSGGKIVGIGAAAKGNTFLNFYRLDNTIIDYVTDSSPQKQGKYTPLTRIPIVGDEILAQYDEVYAIILSWNISTQIKKILYKINPNIKFISPEDC